MSENKEKKAVKVENTCKEQKPAKKTGKSPKKCSKSANVKAVW